MTQRSTLALLAAAAALPLSACELGHKITAQTGPRGAGTDQIVDARHIQKQAEIPAPPYPLTTREGPRATTEYKNVQVLGDISVDEFNRLMVSISQWVAPPEQGCTYCHNPENMASDEIYRKKVARRMIQMTRHINSDWRGHVQNVGVTCYTCHRGNDVPKYVWTYQPQGMMTTIRGNKHGQNTPDPNVGYASLPYDPFDSYLQGARQVRVASNSPYPDDSPHVSIKTAEKTYGLMMHISSALGVNCTYCHNTQSFRSWPESRGQRVTAYYGIRMVRNVNDAYLSSLKSVFPANRLGPMGDPYKVNCATCHQGLSKPLGGVSMLPDNPALAGVYAQIATPPAAPSAGMSGGAAPPPGAGTGMAPGTVPTRPPVTPTTH